MLEVLSRCVFVPKIMDYFRPMLNLEKRRCVRQNIYSAPPQPVKKKLRFYRCRKKNSDELSMSVGDIIAVNILGNNLKSSFLAKNLNTGEIGFTFLFSNLYPYSIPEFQPWFCLDVNRREAKEILLQEGNKPGSFLVRSSMTNDYNPYSLSIRCFESKPKIKHYKIFKNSFGFYIEKKIYQETLEDLIELYLNDDRESCRLCQKITHPYIRQPK